jgi:hypothetical protein
MSENYMISVEAAAKVLGYISEPVKQVLKLL